MKNERTKYLVKNTAIFAIGNIATKLITFFLIPLYTNALTTSEYGIVDLVNTICTVLAPIIILNIGESIMRFSLDKDSDYLKIISVGIVVYIMAIVVGILIFPVTSFFPVISEYSVYIYFYTITCAGSQLLLCYLRGKEELIYYVMGGIIQISSATCFNIIFLLFLRLGVEGYFIAYIISSFITIIYASIAGNVWNLTKKFYVDGKLMKQMIKYSVVLIPNTFIWWIMNSSDRIMIIYLVGIDANGIYAISYKLPTLVSTLATMFNQAWNYSAIRERGSEDELEYNNRIFRKLICVIMLMGICILTFAKPFLKIYVSRNYYSAWKYIPFLTVGCVYLTLASFIATSYTVHKDSFGYLFSGILGAVFNIILNFMLIPYIEVYGAAIATCVSYISVFIFRLFHTKKYIKYNICNIEFIVGSILIIFSSGLMFVDNIIGIGLQICVCIISVLLYTYICLPELKIIIKQIINFKK